MFRHRETIEEDNSHATASLAPTLAFEFIAKHVRSVDARYSVL